MHDLLSFYILVVQPVPERLVLLTRASSGCTHNFTLFNLNDRNNIIGHVGLGTTSERVPTCIP